jgi:hypothetical protein
MLHIFFSFLAISVSISIFAATPHGRSNVAPGGVFVGQDVPDVAQPRRPYAVNYQGYNSNDYDKYSQYPVGSYSGSYRGYPVYNNTYNYQYQYPVGSYSDSYTYPYNSSAYGDPYIYSGYYNPYYNPGMYNPNTVFVNPPSSLNYPGYHPYTESLRRK